MNKDKIFGIIYAIAGALIMLGPKTLFAVCNKVKEDGSHMTCYYTSQTEIGVGIGIIMFGLMILLLKDRIGKVVAICGVLFLSVMALVVPNWLIGVCKGKMMQCHIVTLPALNIISAFLFILCVLHMILVLKEKSKEK